ncbi:hypothetical protein BDR26DRAFT_869333 [Obelidium mucronatum]|nr:hypothetical protein BDR26DRAFT_869333 [Obelidium mucronatum]
MEKPNSSLAPPQPPITPNASKRMSLVQLFAGNQAAAAAAAAASAGSGGPTTPAGRRMSSESSNSNQQRLSSTTNSTGLGLASAITQVVEEEEGGKEDNEIDPQAHETSVLNSLKKVLPGRVGAMQLIRALDPAPSGKDTGMTTMSSNSYTSVKPLTSLSVDSEVEEFRTFHDEIAHPANVLNLVAEETDRHVFTEFDHLCNELLSNLGDFEAALEELTIWKDDFMTQSVPSTIKLQLTMLFARLFRSKSVMHEPTFELIRQVRLYSRPWMNKRHALLELEKDYQRQGHVLDVAIRKLEQLQIQIQRLRSDKKIALWERLCHKIFAVYIDEPEKEAECEPDSPPRTPRENPTLKPSSRLHQSSNLLHSNSHARLSRSRSRTLDPNMRRNSPHGSTRSFNDRHGSGLNEKQEIKAVISEKNPSWFKKAKSKANQFTKVLLKHHPKYIEKLTRLHRYPYVQRNNVLKYVSQRSDTLILRKLRKPNMPRCWSLIDTERFGKKGIEAGTSDIGHGNVLTNPQLISQIRKSRYSIVRSNSFNLFSELQFSSLKHPEVLLGINMVDELERDFNHDPNRSRAMSEDELDEEYIEDGEGLSDINYFGDFDSEMVDEMIDKYMNPYAKDKADLPNETDIINATEDESAKDTFTMQDVMELTLLHAQQMHLMQKEYEDRIRSQDAQMEVLKQSLADADLEYENRMKQANERAQRLAQKYMNHRGSTENTAKAAEGAHGTKGGGGAGGDDGSSSDSEDGKKKGKAGKDKKKKTSSKVKEVKSSLYSKEVKAPVIKPVIKLHKHEHVVKKKVFTSAPFSMNFMERLRWFTEERLKKMRELQDKFTSQEIAANEERLNQLKLIRRHKNIIEDSMYRDAEFVPYPGHVPTHKMRKAWIDQGVTLPWGARFQSMKKWENKPNVLNLFDIALKTIPRSSRPPEELALNENQEADSESSDDDNYVDERAESKKQESERTFVVVPDISKTQ